MLKKYPLSDGMKKEKLKEFISKKPVKATNNNQENSIKMPKARENFRVPGINAPVIEEIKKNEIESKTCSKKILVPRKLFSAKKIKKDNLDVPVRNSSMNYSISYAGTHPKIKVAKPLSPKINKPLVAKPRYNMSLD